MTYRATADTFSVPDFPPRWVVRQGDVVDGEPVQLIARGALVRCLGVTHTEHEAEKPGPDERLTRLRPQPDAVFALFEDCRTGEVHRYQLSLRPLWPWEEA